MITMSSLRAWMRAMRRNGSRGAGQQAGEIARAVADDRQRLLGERGKDELAGLSVGARAARVRVDDLGIEVILPDVRAVLGFEAFAGDARADHFGESVDVDGIDREAVLDLAPHRLGPGLGAVNADGERGAPRIDALAIELVGDRQHVARRHHDDARAKIPNQLDLPLGHAARSRDDRATEPLGAVVDAEAAGEEPVAVRDVDEIAGPAARGADRASADARPGVEVLRACSRRSSACRWCRSKREPAPRAPAAPRTCRTGRSRGDRPWW